MFQSSLVDQFYIFVLNGISYKIVGILKDDISTLSETHKQDDQWRLYGF